MARANVALDIERSELQPVNGQHPELATSQPSGDARNGIDRKVDIFLYLGMDLAKRRSLYEVDLALRELHVPQPPHQSINLIFNVHLELIEGVCSELESLGFDTVKNETELNSSFSQIEVKLSTETLFLTILNGNPIRTRFSCPCECCLFICNVINVVMCFTLLTYHLFSH